MALLLFVAPLAFAAIVAPAGAGAARQASQAACGRQGGRAPQQGIPWERFGENAKYILRGYIRGDPAFQDFTSFQRANPTWFITAANPTGFYLARNMNRNFRNLISNYNQHMDPNVDFDGGSAPLAARSSQRKQYLTLFFFFSSWLSSWIFGVRRSTWFSRSQSWWPQLPTRLRRGGATTRRRPPCSSSCASSRTTSCPRRPAAAPLPHAAAPNAAANDPPLNPGLEEQLQGLVNDARNLHIDHKHGLHPRMHALPCFPRSDRRHGP